MAFVDEVTKLPLPILPLAPPGDQEQRSDSHHAFYERDTFENGTPGQRAVRFSRLQYGSRYFHDRYHRMFSGSALPETPLEEFTLTVLGYAGYVPEVAVDTSRSEPKIVTMTKRQKHHLQLPGILKTEHRKGRRAEIGQFLMMHTLSHDFNHVDNVVKDEFLHTANDNRKRELGFWLVARAIEAAVEPVDPLYELAKKNKALRVDAAPCARVAVRQQIIKRAPDYFGTLEELLIAS